LKKAALCYCDIKVVQLQNRNTQNIVGFDHDRGIFSTDFFQMVSYAENGTGLNIMRKIIENIIFFGGKNCR
jgi:hypothetical protein